VVKPIIVATIALGLLGSLTIFTLSDRESRTPRAPQAQHQAIDRAPNLLPLSGFAAVTPQQTSTATAALPPPAPTSQQLQLEIEHALTSDDADERYRAYMQLVPSLIAMDPAAMQHVFASTPPGTIREQLLHHTSRAWSATNVTGAIQWANAMSDENERVIAAREIVAQLGQTDASQAIEVADVFGVGRDDGTVDHIALLWAAQDLNASLQWVEAQPPGVQRDRLLARVNTIQAAASPGDAANTALNDITPGPIQDDAVADVVHSWSFQDAAAASHWVGELPQGRLRDLAKAALTPAN
jgi:hypothetical protein